MILDCKSFDKIFHILCLLITGGMVNWCLYNYCLDLDVCLVDQKAFGEEDNYITPAISLCFMDPVMQKKLVFYDVLRALDAEKLVFYDVLKAWSTPGFEDLGLKLARLQGFGPGAVYIHGLVWPGLAWSGLM